MADYQGELDRLARRYESLRLMVTAVREAVDAARKAGAPWEEIAEVLAIPEDDLTDLFADRT